MTFVVHLYLIHRWGRSPGFFLSTCALMKHSLFMLLLAGGGGGGSDRLNFGQNFTKVQPLIPLIDGGAIAFPFVLIRKRRPPALCFPSRGSPINLHDNGKRGIKGGTPFFLQCLRYG